MMENENSGQDLPICNKNLVITKIPLLINPNQVESNNSQTANQMNPPNTSRAVCVCEDVDPVSDSDTVLSISYTDLVDALSHAMIRVINPLLNYAAEHFGHPVNVNERELNHNPNMPAVDDGTSNVQINKSRSTPVIITIDDDDDDVEIVFPTARSMGTNITYERGTQQVFKRRLDADIQSENDLKIDKFREASRTSLTESPARIRPVVDKVAFISTENGQTKQDKPPIESNPSTALSKIKKIAELPNDTNQDEKAKDILEEESETQTSSDYAFSVSASSSSSSLFIEVPRNPPPPPIKPKLSERPSRAVKRRICYRCFINPCSCSNRLDDKNAKKAKQSTSK